MHLACETTTHVLYLLGWMPRLLLYWKMWRLFEGGYYLRAATIRDMHTRAFICYRCTASMKNYVSINCHELNRIGEICVCKHLLIMPDAITKIMNDTITVEEAI